MTDVVTNPSAKEKYERQFNNRPEIFKLWTIQAEKAFKDSVSVSLPYTEAGLFFPKSFPVHSYEVALNPGENLQVEIEIDSLETLVFLDLFKQENDSLSSFKHVKSGAFKARSFQKEISEPGIYKILIQPEIEAHTPFHLTIQKQPVYNFPVASVGNGAAQSLWGASRDAGRRTHEGVDIFAPRGTPVIAASQGRVTSTANKGLGGKQVWVQDKKRRSSQYYAHLDSIIAVAGSIVSPGDTLGFVGNTGNARTTPPHLHFGIYQGRRGALNPLPFIFQTKKPIPAAFPSGKFTNNLGLTINGANLRSGPSAQTAILQTLNPQDTLRLLGKTTNWYHIRSGDSNSFIHESLIVPVPQNF